MKQFSLSLHGARSSDTEPFFLILMISSQYIYFIHHDHWGSCWQCCASVLPILGTSPPTGTLAHIVNIGSSRPSIRIELPPPPRAESVGQEVYAETVFSILRSLVSFLYLHFPNPPAPSSAAPPRLEYYIRFHHLLIHIHSPDQEIVPSQPVVLVLSIRPVRQPARDVVVGYCPTPDEIEIGSLIIDPIERSRDLPTVLERKRYAQEVLPSPPFLFSPVCVRAGSSTRREGGER